MIVILEQALFAPRKPGLSVVEGDLGEPCEASRSLRRNIARLARFLFKLHQYPRAFSAADRLNYTSRETNPKNLRLTHHEEGKSNMKQAIFCLVLALSLPTYAQTQKPAPTLKSILLEQLRSTHNQAEWFVPANTAVEGLTPEQASWTDGKGNHSIGQLTNHLIFWNRQSLAKFKGETPEKFSGNNDETFNSFDSKQWNAAVQQLDQVLTDWEKVVEAADETKLKDWYSTIAHIGTHNAYHIGQIIYVRKEQGSWNPAKGVN